MGAVALQARRAGPTAVAGILVHFHAVHASEAGVGAAVGTLFVESWGVGLDTVKATQRSPFSSPEVEAKALGVQSILMPCGALPYSPTHRTPDTP